MNINKVILSLILFFGLFAESNSADTSIISGRVVNWSDSLNLTKTIGDFKNHVSLSWSQSGGSSGFFYGSDFLVDSDVAFATDVTEISQITDASIFDFISSSVGPHCDADCDPDGVGDFIVWRNKTTGHYGVLRIDDIDSNFLLSGTWWFQTDGSSDFSNASSNNDCIASYSIDGGLYIPCVSAPDEFGENLLYQADIQIKSSSSPVSFEFIKSKQIEGLSIETNSCLAKYNSDGSLNVPCVFVPSVIGDNFIYEVDMESTPLSSPFALPFVFIVTNIQIVN